MPQPPNIPRISVTDVPDTPRAPTRIVELRRPEKLNCLSLGMLDDLLSALRNSQASCLLLTGEGRSFCTDLDLKEVDGPGGGTLHLQRLVAVYRWFLRAEIPTVALARGYAVGGGAGLVACCRTAIVSSDFRFRLPGGDLSRLAAVVIPLCNLRTGGKTPESGWLGCELDAAQALRLGLVDKVVSPERLKELVQIARSGTLAPELQQGTKRHQHSVDCAVFALEQFLQHSLKR